MAPRVSLIAAIDSEGRSYLCLFHGNTNAQIMEIYLRNLVKKLDKQRPDWRDNTVIMCDGATYHTCDSTLKLLRHLRVPVLFTAPHCYSSSPIELYFAALKAVDLNPRKLSMGKQNFSNVVNAVVMRARAISHP
jgi:transposase